MSHNLDLEPGLLPTSDLKMILLNVTIFLKSEFEFRLNYSQKGVKLSNSETKEGLIELFNKYVKPQPQRSRKSKNDAQIICLYVICDFIFFGFFLNFLFKKNRKNFVK